MEEFMIITSYYPPEIGAASNRIYHLADGLKKEFKVRIVTPLPNYPTGKIFPEYRGKNKLVTQEEGIEITDYGYMPANQKINLCDYLQCCLIA
jgi:hypothetical protein